MKTFWIWAIILLCAAWNPPPPRRSAPDRPLTPPYLEMPLEQWNVIVQWADNPAYSNSVTVLNVGTENGYIRVVATRRGNTPSETSVKATFR